MRVVALDRIAASVRAAPAKAGTIRLLAIDGHSGAGKTTLALRLAARLGPDPVTPAPTVHLDDLYPGWDGLADGVHRLVSGVLRPLAVGEPAGYRRYDWRSRQDAEWCEIPPADVVVVEGVGCGSRLARQWLSTLIWVAAPEPVRRRRGITRDGGSFARHWQRWAEQEHRLFLGDPVREHADLVIDGDPGTRAGQPGVRTRLDPDQDVVVMVTRRAGIP